MTATGYTSHRVPTWAFVGTFLFLATATGFIVGSVWGESILGVFK